MPEILTSQEIFALHGAGELALRASRERLLVADLRPGPLTEAAGTALQGLPCPVVAVSERALNAAELQAVDCIVSDPAALTAVARTVAQAPLAAMTLVQLSRAIEVLDVMSGLDMESVTYGCLQGGEEYRNWLAAFQAEAWPAVSEAPPVQLERDGHCLVVTLNRPELRNSITVEMRDALVEAFELALLDKEITRLVLRGAGKCFSVGGELREFGSVPDSVTGHWVRQQRLPGRWLARVADRAEAQVHGACIGAGIELPAFARRLVAAPGSYFQLPELQFGLIPGAGGCVSIAKRIGRHRFNLMALSGKRIKVEQALAWGLVDAIGKA